MTRPTRRAPALSSALVVSLAALAPSLAAAQQYECAPLGTNCDAEIPDAYGRFNTGVTAGVLESTLTVLPGDCPIDALIVDVDLEVDIVHPYVGDLGLELVHPDGTAVELLHRPGIGLIELTCPGDDLRVILDDEGTSAFDACAQNIPAVEGRLVPWNPLSILDGRVRNGTWRLRVKDDVRGERGVLRGWTLHLPCSLDLPLVEIEALDGLVSERGDDDVATVRVKRSGDTSAELEVAYAVTGTASSDDIEPLPGTITLPAGSASATFDVRAVADELDEIDETVILTLVPTQRYQIGPRGSAQVLVREGSVEDELDAGTPDAGSGGEDAGRQVIDAGDPGTAPDEGCGCQATHAPARTGAHASLAALLLLGLFGRRRARGLLS